MQAKRTAFNTGTSTLSSRAQQQLTELEAKKLSSDRGMVTLTGHSITVTHRIPCVTFTCFGFV